MRIISGKHRSRIIDMVGIDTTRETSDKVRGAIFNLINSYPMQGVCLDLFSGSGAMGLEALSRGADFCYFNDKNRKAYEVTKKNCKSLGYDKSVIIYNLDYQLALKQISRPCNFVFLDPPYALNCYYEIMCYLMSNQLLKDNSLIICEAGINTEINIPLGLELYKAKEYGIKKVLIYRKVRDQNAV